MSLQEHNHGAAAGTGAQGSGGYTCPMHPEVHRAEPGKCPICGMTLVPQTSAEGQKT